MVSSILNICSSFLYFTELTWLQNKFENNPLLFIYLYTLFIQKFQFSVAGLNGDYTAVSIDIDAYYWDTQGVATFFSWCQMPRVPEPEQMSNSLPP